MSIEKGTDDTGIKVEHVLEAESGSTITEGGDATMKVKDRNLSQEFKDNTVYLDENARLKLGK